MMNGINVNWEIVVGFSAVVIGLISFVYSIRTFQSQEKRAEREARASVRPILKIRTQKYANKKSVKLVNAGIGPAIISNAVFSRNGEKTNSIVDLFDLDVEWDTFINVPQSTALAVQEELELIALSAEHLVSQGLSDDQQSRILAQWDIQKTGISVAIEYKDIYGNEQPPITEVLN